MSDKPEHFGYQPAGFFSTGVDLDRVDDHLSVADAWRAVNKPEPASERKPPKKLWPHEELARWKEEHCLSIVGERHFADGFGLSGTRCMRPTASTQFCTEHTS